MIQPRLFFGMHPNAEINFRTAECDKVFELLTMLAGTVSTHELRQNNLEVSHENTSKSGNL